MWHREQRCWAAHKREFNDTNDYINNMLKQHLSGGPKVAF